MKNVSDIINRIKRLQEFEVCVTLPDNFAFTGRVPFDMRIEGETAKVRVFAETLNEAQQKAEEYFNGPAA